MRVVQSFCILDSRIGHYHHYHPESYITLMFSQRLLSAYPGNPNQPRLSLIIHVLQGSKRVISEAELFRYQITFNIELEVVDLPELGRMYKIKCHFFWLSNV
jgi:hypothetical protein